MQEENSIETQDTEEITDSLDNMRDQLDELMETQLEEVETAYKKTVIYSIVWSITTVVVYFIWSNSWYFCVPAAIAIVMTGLLAYIFTARKKLRSVLN